jgi:hypothetical protein
VIAETKYDPYGQVKAQSVPYEVSPGSGYRPPTSQADTLISDILGRVLSVKATDNLAARSYDYQCQDGAHQRQ